MSRTYRKPKAKRYCRLDCCAYCNPKGVPHKERKQASYQELADYRKDN